MHDVPTDSTCDPPSRPGEVRAIGTLPSPRHMHHHVVRTGGAYLQVDGATGERVIVEQNVEAGDPILLPTAAPIPLGPLVHADSGPYPGAERPPKVPNKIQAILVAASQGVARYVERPRTRTDLHPESVA